MITHGRHILDNVIVTYIVILIYDVTQGFKLSSALCFMCVNDIRSSLEYGKLVQYVDFTTLCFSGRSKFFLEQNTTENLNSLVKLFHNDNFKTNAFKSITFISMYFTLYHLDSECVVG